MGYFKEIPITDRWVLSERREKKLELPGYVAPVSRGLLELMVGAVVVEDQLGRKMVTGWGRKGRLAVLFEGEVDEAGLRAELEFRKPERIWKGFGDRIPFWVPKRKYWQEMETRFNKLEEEGWMEETIKLAFINRRWGPEYTVANQETMERVLFDRLREVKRVREEIAKGRMLAVFTGAEPKEDWEKTLDTKRSGLGEKIVEVVAGLVVPARINLGSVGELTRKGLDQRARLPEPREARPKYCNI